MSEKNNKENKKLPAAKFRFGNVTATVWENPQKNEQGEEYILHSIVVERNYKDKNEEWQTTNNFTFNDLVGVKIVSEEALKFIKLKKE